MAQSSRNLIDYDVISSCKSFYSNKAEQLSELLRDMKSTNTQMLNGFDNETSHAFVERFDGDHAKAIQNVIASLDDISRYLGEYAERRRSEDRPAS